MPQPTFEIDLLVPGRPQEVWARLWDLDRHTAAIPLTTVHGGTLGPDASFVARTGAGRLHLDDEMVVREWDPPRRAVVAKVGSVLQGSIEVELRPAGQGTRLRWRQDFGAARVPAGAAGLAAPAVRAAYLAALRRITRP